MNLKKSLLGLGLACMLTGSAFAQNFAKPVDYLSYFNQEFFEIQQLQIDYMSLMVHSEGEEVDAAQKKLQAKVDAAIQKFQNVAAYPKDNGLKQNATQALTSIKEIAAHDNEAAAETKIGCQKCFEAVLLESDLDHKDGEALREVMQKMNKSIAKFAKENDIKMTEGENSMDNVIGKVNKINEYLRNLNMVVLQMQYADEKVNGLLEKADVAALKTELKKLEKANAEAKKRFDKIGKIPEDVQCHKSVEMLVAHYKTAAEKYYPDMIAAYDKNGKLINAKVDSYNKSAQMLNMGNTKIQKYQQSRIDLLRRYVPQPTQPTFRS